MTKQLNNYFEPWTSIKAIKKLRKNRNGIQKQIEQKNYKNLSFFNLSFFIVQRNIKPNKIPLQIEQWKTLKTRGKS